ncbi:MAG TPA: hypothetical protein VGK30_18955 [Candidatus Binatia bacterium]
MRSALTATSADRNAKGQVGLGIRGNDGTFDLKASHLDRNTGYDVVVGGVKVGALQATRGGSGHIRFRTSPSSKDRVLGFDPRGKSISIRNAAGNDVLVGSLPSDSIDPTAIACCVPDNEGGSACEDLTSDACTAAGGTATEAASCMPDPCATTPPSTATVCCTNQTEDDGSETECEDHAATDCTAAGGTVVQATSCEPNPCAPVTPPAGDVVACCIADEGETECEERTAEACTAENGTAMAGATCDADPCGIGSGPGSGDGGDGGGTDGEDGNGGNGGGGEEER